MVPGDGYTLTMMVNNETVVEAIKRKVEEHLPSATLANIHSGELTFKLPPDTDKFAAMLDALSAQKETLGLRHISLSLTNMERVFLRLVECVSIKKCRTSESRIIKTDKNIVLKQKRIRIIQEFLLIPKYSSTTIEQYAE